MTLDASANRTGVDAVHTGPHQWLKTMVEDPGCHVTRRKRPSPLTSPRTTVRVLDASTPSSMHPDQS
jgi:hypothetical protein